MEITKKMCESAKGPFAIYTLRNAAGATVELSELGAGIGALCVPDVKGQIANVSLAYAEPDAYFYDGPCLGKVPGRYANRIASGRFSIDGTQYQLDKNQGDDALHGGCEGFQNQIWKGVPTDNGVTFTYVSADGEEHYPGEMTVEAAYTWTDDCTLTLRLSARSTKPTVVNLTNHAYWNLRGADSGCALAHLLKLNASHYLPTSEALIPTGEIAAVEGTPMDFRQATPIGLRIREDFSALCFGKGYDACWVIDAAGQGMHEAAVLTDVESGRVLRVSTDQPAVQVYTGNWLAGCPANRSGRSYDDYDGVAIEAQGFPDAPNHPNFPTQILRPGETYARTIEFAFSTL